MIEDTFLKLKSNLELSDTFQSAVSTQHNAVRSVVENAGLKVETRLIGSLGRRTRIPPKPGQDFDIDVLVIMGSFYNWVSEGGVSTDKAMNDVHGAVVRTDRYSKMRPELDHPTITFQYGNGVAMELVPGYRDQIGKRQDGSTFEPKGRAYWVPASRGRWELADYDYEAEQITAINKSTGGVLIPTVKMLKAAKREHFPSMKSYHLEVITSQMLPGIIQAYKDKGVTPTYPMLIASVLFHLEGKLDREWGIPGSLSPPFTVPAAVKAELQGGNGWLQTTVQKAYNAETDAEAHQTWKLIFKDDLPLR
jgi:hypothetical protein